MEEMFKIGKSTGNFIFIKLQLFYKITIYNFSIIKKLILGELILAKAAPSDMIQDVFYLTIAAFDGGRPSLKTTYKVMN